MNVVVLLLIVLAFVLTLLDGVGVRHPRLSLGWLGVAAALAALLITDLHLG